MIRHFLADGREVESIEGIVIPTTGVTEAVYRIVADHQKNPKKTIQKNKEAQTNATT